MKIMMRGESKLRTNEQSIGWRLERLRRAALVDLVDVSDRLIGAYNVKDFDTMATLIAEDVDFAHFNRDFNLGSRDALLDVLKQFAQTCVPDRQFEKPERIFAVGDKVVREAYYAGTAAIDLPGFGAAGEAFRLKFCSVMRFSSDGILLEWKDYG